MHAAYICAAQPCKSEAPCPTPWPLLTFYTHIHILTPSPSLRDAILHTSTPTPVPLLTAPIILTCRTGAHIPTLPPLSPPCYPFFHPVFHLNHADPFLNPNPFLHPQMFVGVVNDYFDSQKVESDDGTSASDRGDEEAGTREK